MIDKLCLKICCNFIKTGIITTENEYLYYYGMHQGIVMLLNILTALLIGFMFNSVPEVILYFTAYIPLRSYAGGYHAQTPQRCYFFSVMLITAILLAIKAFPVNAMICCIGVIINVIIIFILAPIEDKNKPFTEKEQVFFKKRTRFLLLLETAVFVITLPLHDTMISTCILMAFSTVTLMLILGHMKNRTTKKEYIEKSTEVY